MKSPGLGDPGCMEFTSRTPHFFKVILDDTGRCEKLRIPKKFAKRYGSDISSPVFLKVPSGAVWEVELKMCDDDTWLCNGWPEFAKHYSLGYGSFLVFRYEGNCHFHVIIFDKTALEIAYPCIRTHVKVPNPTNGGFQDLMMEDDISVEILDDVPPSKKTRVRSASPSSQPRRMTRSTSNLRSLDIKSSRVKCEIQEPEFDAKRSGKHPQQREVCRRKPKLEHKERDKALLEASSFNSKHPFFAVVMYPSYIYDRLRVPYFFIGEHVKQNVKDVKLQIGDRLWPVKLYRCPKYRQTKLTSGWGTFVTENSVKVGEVCMFELINREEAVLKVHIFRKSAE
ncbi:hypothetical protein SLA2020_116030 [Shorea laevis]